jgi:hypothetical protein
MPNDQQDCDASQSVESWKMNRGISGGIGVPDKSGPGWRTGTDSLATLRFNHVYS